jgi:hypothetical protein
MPTIILVLPGRIYYNHVTAPPMSFPELATSFVALAVRHGDVDCSTAPPTSIAALAGDVDCSTGDFDHSTGTCSVHCSTEMVLSIYTAVLQYGRRLLHHIRCPSYSVRCIACNKLSWIPLSRLYMIADRIMYVELLIQRPSQLADLEIAGGSA